MMPFCDDCFCRDSTNGGFDNDIQQVRGNTVPKDVATLLLLLLQMLFNHQRRLGLGLQQKVSQARHQDGNVTSAATNIVDFNGI